jgi:sugar phosphate isomerase/epimerase
VLERATDAGVRLAFEPEPGMFIDSMARFAELRERLPHEGLGLTLDIGHLVCLDDGDWREPIARWRDLIWNVHIEDMRRGLHEHLMFGEGEIDFDAVFEALRAAHYAGPLNVELSRHSHDAVRAARSAHAFLRPRIAKLCG